MSRSHRNEAFNLLLQICRLQTPDIQRLVLYLINQIIRAQRTIDELAGPNLGHVEEGCCS
jgi:hypothetical protein